MGFDTGRRLFQVHDAARAQGHAVEERHPRQRRVGVLRERQHAARVAASAVAEDDVDDGQRRL